MYERPPGRWGHRPRQTECREEQVLVSRIPSYEQLKPKDKTPTSLLLPQSDGLNKNEHQTIGNS